MKYCKPDSCTCPAENDETEPRTVDIDFGKLKQKAKLIKKKFNKINKLCPNNTPPTSCKCLGDAENSITPPFDDPLDVLECLPSRSGLCFSYFLSVLSDFLSREKLTKKKMSNFAKLKFLSFKIDQNGKIAKCQIYRTRFVYFLPTF